MTTTTERLGYSQREAAEAVGLSLATVKRAIASGALKAKRTSTDADGNPTGSYVITPDAIKAWVDGMADA